MNWILLYHLGLIPISIIATPFFLLSKRGRERLIERFGFWQLKSQDEYLWFHGASLGEIAGIEPVIQNLKKNDLKNKILITSSSATGLQRAEKFADQAKLLPFDSFFFYNNALKDLNIKRLIISETELWPGLLDYAKHKKIETAIINARISDYTVNSYKRLRWLFKPLFQHLYKLIAVSEKSKQRFINLGVSEKIITVLPNTKYDKAKALSSPAESFGTEIFKNQNTIITLGCLRPGEEEFWFPAVAKAIQSLPINFIIAPRHAEKFAYFAAKLSEYNISFQSWSDIKNTNAGDKKVLLLNVYGKLEAAYSISSAAFIGATLVDIGGHNPLDAACYGCYLALGPYVSTIEEIVLKLLSENACITINSIDDALNFIDFVCKNPEEAKLKGQAAEKVYLEFNGVSKKVLMNLGLVENA
ncbi:MAG: hypothetical protein KDD56_04670 [Bdellovibrionales bacterium]|nr:hypothetical protein [Bdellovibrionales bacterium]